MASFGLVPHIRLTGMIADLEFAERPAARGLRVAKVSDRETATDFAAVLSEAFGFPQDICEAEFVDKALWREEAYASVSYYHDEPASVSSVIIVDQVLYVGLVATRPAFRNKGLAMGPTITCSKRLRPRPASDGPHYTQRVLGAQSTKNWAFGL